MDVNSQATEYSEIYTQLDDDKQGYAMAVLHTLKFAQDSQQRRMQQGSDPPPDKSPDQRAG